MMSAGWPAAVYSGAGDALAAGLRAAVFGQVSPRTVLLTGPPGSGESTTLRAVGQLLGERGFRVYQLAAADEVSYRKRYGLMTAMLGLDLAHPPPAGTAERVLGVVDELCAEVPLALCVDDAHLGR